MEGSYLLAGAAGAIDAGGVVVFAGAGATGAEFIGVAAELVGVPGVVALGKIAGVTGLAGLTGATGLSSSCCTADPFSIRVARWE